MRMLGVEFVAGLTMHVAQRSSERFLWFAFSRALVVLMTCLLPCGVLGQGTASGARHHFSAVWVTAAGVPAHDPAVVRLRKELTLEAVPAHYVVHVSADNQFLLMVNGKRVGQGPAIGDVPHWRYETYDLAPVLHAGSNVLAATVWNLGDEAPIRQMTSRLGFVVDPDGPTEVGAKTDETWIARRDTGWAFLPKPAELGGDYYVGSPGERMDGAAMDWGWAAAAAAEALGSGWAPAVAVGGAVERGVHSESNSWLLVADRLPEMAYEPTEVGRVVRATGLGDGVKFPDAPVTVAPGTKAVLLLDRGALTTAFPTLTVSGGRGGEIRVKYAEALVDAKGEKGNRNEIAGKHLVGVADVVLPDGAAGREYTPLDWRTWRYMEIEVTAGPEAVRLEGLRAAFTAFPFDHRAQFASDDAGLEQIWNVGWRTARLCAHDAYMDTPYWERLQYVGDTRIQTLISYTNAGDDRLARQAISAFHDSLLPEGVGQSRYPSRHLQVIQNFSLLWVGMVHDFWYWRDDADFVREQLPAIRSELSYFRARRDGDGLPSLRDWWPFVDWAEGFPGGSSPMKDGVSAAGGLFYLAALGDAAEMEAELGDASLAREDREEADALRVAVRRRFWSESEGLIADTTELRHFSQQANALAVWLDVVPKEQQRQVMTRVYSVTDAGFRGDRPAPPGMSPASNYFRFYLTRALAHAGMADRYVETLAPWRTMLGVGLTTWAEQPEPTRSDSHAWSAHPNIDLLTTVGGIRPVAPGFGRVEVAPALGALKRVRVLVPTVKGDISADYAVESGGRVKAILGMPAGLPGVMRWDGKEYPLRAGRNVVDLPAPRGQVQ